MKRKSAVDIDELFAMSQPNRNSETAIVHPADQCAVADSSNTSLSIPSNEPIKSDSASKSVASGTGMVDWAHSFRRQWTWALGLGLFGGIVAATSGWITWQPEFTPRATLRVLSQPPAVLGAAPNADQNSFEMYKKTQEGLIRDRFVLNAAMRDKEVLKLPIVSQQLDPVEWLQNEIRVAFAKDSEILQISLRSNDAEEATVIVNAVCDAYINLVVAAEKGDRLTRQATLRTVQNEAELKIRQKRAELIKLTETLGTGDARAATLKQQTALETYAALRRELLQTQLQLMRQDAKQATHQARVESLKSMEIPRDILDARVKQHPDYAAAAALGEKLRQSLNQAQLVAVEGQPRVFDNYRRDLERAEQKMEQVQATLKPSIEAQLRSELTQKFMSELDAVVTEVSTLRTQCDRLEADVSKLAAEANQIGRASVDLEMLRVELNSLEAMRQQVTAEAETLRIELESQAGRVVLLSKATPPRSADTRSRTRRVLTYGAAGFFAPFFLVCWWDARRKRVNSVHEVSGSTGLQIIGTMPLIPMRARRQLVSDSRPTIWNRLLTESIDSIREALLNERRSREMKIVLVSSATQGEGKTTVATQLAKSFARAGHQTLLVDCDLRCPATHVAFEERSEFGVADILSGACQLHQAICVTSEPQLWHLSAGNIIAGCHEQLSKVRSGLSGMFSQLREQFDVVIVDSCPILPVVDTLIVSQFADTAILSVMRDVSQSQQILEAVSRLERSAIRVLGAVVTSKPAGTYGSVYNHLYASRY